MHIVSNGDNLHEMSNPIFWGKKYENITNLSSAELAQKVVKVKVKNSNWITRFVLFPRFKMCFMRYFIAFINNIIRSKNLHMPEIPRMQHVLRAPYDN